MKSKLLKRLGYGVAIHFNPFRKKFEVYKLGTYYPSEPKMNTSIQMVTSDKKIKKAIYKYIKKYK